MGLQYIGLWAKSIHLKHRPHPNPDEKSVGQDTPMAQEAARRKPDFTKEAHYGNK